MAKAYKCDRCGKLYTEPNQNELKKPYIAQYDNFYCFNPLDICSLCQAKFEAWWDAGKQEGDKNGK